MKRWRTPALVVALLGIAAGVLAHMRGEALARAERLLTQRGFTWEHSEAGLLHARWTGLDAPGIQVEVLEARLWPDAQADFIGLRLDLQALKESSSLEDLALSEPIEFWGIEPQVHAEDVDVYWGSHAVLEDLSGFLSPSLTLDSAEQSLSRTDDRWTLRRPYTIDIPHFSGSAQVQVSCDTECRLRVDVTEGILSHPLLSTAPLTPSPTRLEGTIALDTWAFEGDLSHGPLGTTLQVSQATDSTPWQVEFQTEALALADILSLFGTTLPEHGRARPEGTIQLEGRLDGDWNWDVTPTLQDLDCKGLLSDPEGLRHGEVAWTAKDADGNPQARHTGPRVKGFIPIAQAGYLDDAIIAAEDSAFHSHPGYDLTAIREAIRKLRTVPEEGLRGGSTLTQQLAKNLFLDGSQRTLQRKFRELLYALELERVLTKDQILQLYINVVEFGPGTWGASPAAEAMFMKQAQNLTLKEAAYLASVLPAPTTSWNRYYLRGRTPQWRIGLILDNMVDGRTIHASVAQRAQQSPLRFVPP